MPKPQSLTELYFTDYATLPKALKAGDKHTVTFTVRNLEHNHTTYHYKVVAVSPNTNDQQPLAEGTFMLEHDHSQVNRPDITVPTTESRDGMGIRVELYYAVGDSSEIKTQSIHYWVTMSGGLVNKEALP